MVQQPVLQKLHGFYIHLFASFKAQQPVHGLGGELGVLGNVFLRLGIAVALEQDFLFDEVVVGVIHQPFEHLADHCTVGDGVVHFVVQGVDQTHQCLVLRINVRNSQHERAGPRHKGHGDFLQRYSWYACCLGDARVMGRPCV